MYIPGSCSNDMFDEKIKRLDPDNGQMDADYIDMDTKSRPRAASMPSHVHRYPGPPPHHPYWHTLNTGRSAPEIHPSMRNGMATTVPQNMASRSFNNSHQPTVRGRLRHLSESFQSRENFEVKCCRINVLLVVMEIGLGLSITTLAFYMHTLTSALKLRECPYWAGIPLLVSGVVGIYFCALDFKVYATSAKACIIKVLCIILTSSCVFLCSVAAVFPGIHGHRISNYSTCVDANMTCSCILSDVVYIYDSVQSCAVVVTSVKDYLILQCALNAIAGGVSFWFMTLVWKSRYHSFQSGLKFYSYNANRPVSPRI